MECEKKCNTPFNITDYGFIFIFLIIWFMYNSYIQVNIKNKQD
jgi:hypothetical protein